MAKVQAGDLHFMGLLFKRYHRELYGFFYHMCNCPQVSEDMVQNSFYRMIKYSASFTGEGSFRGWMYQLARNVLLDNIKKERNRREEYDISNYSESIDSGTGADEILHKAEQAAQVKVALSRLSPALREVLVMSEYQDLKYREIASILSISEGAVKVRVHRAMNELKNIYLKYEYQR